MWKVTLIFIALVNFGSPSFAEEKQGFPNWKDSDLSSSPKSCILNEKHPNPLNPRTFYHCTNTGPILMKCPEATVFEVSSSSCIKHSTPRSHEDPTCTKEGFFVSKTDCGEYYQCYENGGEYEVVWYTCPGGLYFDERIGTCGYPGSVPCEAGDKNGGIDKTAVKLSAN